MTIQGNDVHLTVRPGPQRVALQQLGTRCGAVVAVDIRTGAVLTMASTPSFNPNAIERNYGQISRIRADCAPFDRIVVHSHAGQNALERLGVPPERIARIAHAALTGYGDVAPVGGAGFAAPAGANFTEFVVIR